MRRALVILLVPVLAAWAGTAAARPRAAAAEAASLLVDVEPREPWVGEPVWLRVRLVLARDLAEEPAYTPPVTTGFWAEAPSRPESYYATLGGRRVLVTETRTRLYPLAPGAAGIGPAAAEVLLASASGAGEDADRTGRTRSLRSAPVSVTVRPLPPGAPPGFEGAVGRLEAAWTADRGRTSLDVPATVRLDVRGTGNLALLKAPALAVPGAEVLTGAREDSLAPAGGGGPGRVRFHWNVLARRTGTLAVAPPAFAWFDPAAGEYRRARLATLAVAIEPPLFSAGPEAGVFPEAFGRDAPDPFARGPRAWAWGLAGLLLGVAAALWRARPAPDPLAEERRRVAAWRSALRGPEGPAFWRAAEEAAQWPGVARRVPAALQEAVAATRYGRAGVDAAGVRARLLAELEAAPPPPRRAAPRRPAAVGLALAAVALVLLVGLPRGEDGGAARLQAADRAAREGEPARAREEWSALWEEGARAPALAARLAWVELAAGRVAPATVWVLRGERAETRDRALGWVAELVREGGGLAGARLPRLPLRRTEWAVLALLLGTAAGVAWPRRGTALALALLAVAAAGAGPAQDLRAGRMRQAVVTQTLELAVGGLQLEPGQVVEVLDRQGGSVRARVGRDFAGRMPAAALLTVEEPR